MRSPDDLMLKWVGSRVYSVCNRRMLACGSIVEQSHSSSAMAQIFDPLPSHASDQILCCYVNATSKIQVARVTNIANWYFERVVFPGQRLIFESLPEALLEIHSGMMASAIISDTIPCGRLRIEDELDATLEVPAPKEAIAHDSRESLTVSSTVE